jgi:tRNA(fMet)-specific endonuclease VapC
MGPLMRYMLDTDTLIYVLNARPQHEAVLERFDREPPQNMVVSAITLAELRFGAAKSNRREATRRRMRHVLDALNVIAFEETAATQYAATRAALEAAGTPIGPLDTLIAAHAMSLRLTLVTGNAREFSRVPGLRSENWIPG